MKYKPTAAERRLCWWYAGKLEQALAQSATLSNAAAARLTSHGINRRSQALAKLAEITFCRWAGLDYALALNWSNEPDCGTDVIFAGRRWDVKHTENGCCLLWPYNKIHTLELQHDLKICKDFDTFALVVGGPYEQRVVGWCSRRFFEQNFTCADDAMPWLTKGTLIVKSQQLRPAQQRPPL